MEKIELLQKLIDESNYIVFFSGAGVSTLSGIKDFRSKDGLYNMKYKYPPEEILSHTFFKNNIEEFYIFYKDKMNCLDKEPNIVHKYMYELEKRGKLKAIITQNIDGLHTKAGNKNYSLLKINIVTGRKNQIRVHMKDNNTPILGDKKYGIKDGYRNMLLLANRLFFVHPITRARIDINLEIPELYLKIVH